MTIIDIGTNTFEYLIARFNSTEFEILEQGVIPVWLGRGGMVDGTITKEAFGRARAAFEKIAELSKKHHSKRSIGVATSASRGAQNIHELEELAESYGVVLQTISGEKEADLIHLGGSLGLSVHYSDYLMMDIGGGSNEFILVANKEVVWRQSFDLGVTRIIEKLRPRDPLSQDDLNQLKLHCRSTLTPLKAALNKNPVNVLVGSAGSFDSLVNMLFAAGSIEKKEGLVLIDLPIFGTFNKMLVKTSLEERMQIPGLIEWRTTTIHIATQLMAEAVAMSGVTKIVRSPYALKEGVMRELMNEQFN